MPELRLYLIWYQLGPILTPPPTELSGKKFFGGSGDLLGHFGEEISFPIHFSIFCLFHARFRRIMRVKPPDSTMDPRYFSSALIELSETLRPYEGSDVTQSVEELVRGLIEENQNLGITRYTILDEKRKPHCVAFDFEIDVVLYFSNKDRSYDFDSPDCVMSVRDIVLTWNIADFDQIHGGFQFVFQDTTVNLLLARDMVTGHGPGSPIQRSEPLRKPSTPTKPVILGDLGDLRTAGEEFPAAMTTNITTTITSRASVVSAGSELVLRCESDEEEEEDSAYHSKATTDMGDIKLESKEVETEDQVTRSDTPSSDHLPSDILELPFSVQQQERVLNHIEEQTRGISDSHDKSFIIENMGKRYSNRLGKVIECCSIFYTLVQLFFAQFGGSAYTFFGSISMIFDKFQKFKFFHRFKFFPRPVNAEGIHPDAFVKRHRGLEFDKFTY
eukprot:sb/3464705/